MSYRGVDNFLLLEKIGEEKHFFSFKKSDSITSKNGQFLEIDFIHIWKVDVSSRKECKVILGAIRGN